MWAEINENDKFLIIPEIYLHWKLRSQFPFCQGIVFFKVLCKSLMKFFAYGNLSEHPCTMRHATCRRSISSAALLNSFVSIRTVTPYFDINAITWDVTDCIMYCTCSFRVRVALAFFSMYEAYYVSTLKIDVPCRLNASKTEHSWVHSPVCQGGCNLFPYA